MPDRTVVSEQVLGALEECQRSFAVHRKCILRLKQAQVADPEEFKETFVECLNRALLVFKREPAVERFVKLVSSFVSFSNDKYARDGDMAATLLEYLIPLTASKDKAVRFRSCQLTAMLLNALGADSEVGEELFEEMADAMLVRLKDKIPVVRVFAASALSRLQDPTDEEDPVTSEYLRLVGSDSSKEVRKAILANIGPSMVTIPHILKRIRDVREDVRKYAYNVVAIKIEARQLSIAQRVDLVGHGLKDRAPIVRKACADMVCKKWLGKCGGNPVEFLKLLDVELHPEQSESALRCVMEHLGMDKLADFLPTDLSALTPEQVFYWRVCGKYATEKNDDDLMDAALPEIPRFCEALNTVVHQPFCAVEMLKLAPLLDLGDEVGRRRLYTMLGAMLLSLRVSDQLVPGLLAGIYAMEGTPQEFLAFASGIIATLASPDQDNGGDEDAPVRRSLTMARELLRMFSDLGTLAQCADQLKALVEGCVQHPSSEVRNEAVECLGLFCCLDEVVAETYVPLLLKVLDNESETTQATALRAMLDILLLFNSATPCQLPASIAAPKVKSEGPEQCVLFRRAVSALEHSSPLVRAVAAEGLAKLLVNTRLQASHGALEEEVLLTLLLKYFSPGWEKDSRARQCLATLFPALARRSPQHLALLARVVVPAVAHATRARKASPLSKINAVQMGQYLLSLLDEAAEPTDPPQPHFVAAATAALRRVCRSLAKELARTGGASATGKACTRLLALVRVQGGGVGELRGLVKAVAEAAEEVDDAVGKKAVAKCAAAVADALAVAQGGAPAVKQEAPSSPDEPDEEREAGEAGEEGAEAPAPEQPAQPEEEANADVEEDVEEDVTVDVMGLFASADADGEDGEWEDEAKPARRARKSTAPGKAKASKGDAKGSNDDDFSVDGDAEDAGPVRRSGRERKTMTNVSSNEAETDRLLEEQENKEIAEWSESEGEDEEEEGEEDEEEAEADADAEVEAEGGAAEEAEEEEAEVKVKQEEEEEEEAAPKAAVKAPKGKKAVVASETEEDEEEEEEVTVKKAKPRAKAAPKAAAKAAPKGKKAAAAEAETEEEEEEEEEEEVAKPVKKAAAKPKAAPRGKKAAAAAEEEEEEGEEEEEAAVKKPRARASRATAPKAAAKPKGKKAAAAAETDEEDEDEEAVVKKPAAKRASRAKAAPAAVEVKQEEEDDEDEAPAKKPSRARTSRA